MGLFEPANYALHWVSVPYLVVAALLLLLLGYGLFTRGDPVMRMAFIAAVAAGTVYAAAQAAAASCVDPALAARWYRWMIAPLALIGPAVFTLLQGEQVQLHAFRKLIGAAAAIATASAVVTLATDWVVAGVWRTDAGLWNAVAGPLLEVHLANLVGWSGAGAIAAARRARTAGGAYARRRYLRFAAVTGLIVGGSVDLLLAHGVGSVPLAWIPALAATGLLVATVHRIDVIRKRGRDDATPWELAIVVAIGGVAWAVAGAPRALATAAVVVAMIAGHAAVGAIRRRAARRRDRVGAVVERALDAFDERCTAVTAIEPLQDAVRDVLEGALGLQRARVLPAGDELLGRALDARVRAWLHVNRAPLARDRLGVERLGGLRAPIEALFAALDAAVVLPLLDRDTLVGVIATGPRADGRPLLDSELDAMARLQDSAARALTWLRLYREATQRAEDAREVEVAAAVQRARSAGVTERAVGACRVVAHYLPAGQFGGDWWAAAELADGRTLVLVGDTTGHGVPAALVTATVEGACEAAQQLLGASFGLFDLMQIFNRAVLSVGRTRYLMSCFAALIDPEGPSVSFANAGHPFPYVCGPSGLRALVSRGTPLGIEPEPRIAVGRMPLAGGDTIVLFTDALVESESERGERYGDRRLQRVLRARGAAADPAELCAAILDDVRVHCGDRPVREDITLVAVQVGMPS